MDDFEPATGSIRYGLTLADLDRLARTACTADRSLAGDMTTRFDIARSAIALALIEADTPPTWHELVRAGWQAIYADIREARHMYGIPRDDTSSGVCSASRYATYWRPIQDDPVEDRLVEALAVHQILDMLTDPYRDAVTALAVHGDYQAAADALGITYRALVGRLRTARRQARAWWFAPETAPPSRGTDRRVGAYGRQLADCCGAGHEWTPENTRWGVGRSPGRYVRRCRACERERIRRRTRERGAA